MRHTGTSAGHINGYDPACELCEPPAPAPPPTRKTDTEKTLELVLPIEELLAQLQRQVKLLERSMYSTLAHAGNGPGARRYSRSKLKGELERAHGAFWFLSELIRHRVPGGGIPEPTRTEVWGKLRAADNVAMGKNPDGTKREGR